jgi:hypothetical protein
MARRRPAPTAAGSHHNGWSNASALSQRVKSPSPPASRAPADRPANNLPRLRRTHCSPTSPHARPDVLRLITRGNSNAEIAEIAEIAEELYISEKTTFSKAPPPRPSPRRHPLLPGRHREPTGNARPSIRPRQPGRALGLRPTQNGIIGAPRAGQYDQPLSVQIGGSVRATVGDADHAAFRGASRLRQSLRAMRMADAGFRRGRIPPNGQGTQRITGSASMPAGVGRDLRRDFRHWNDDGPVRRLKP